MSLKLPIGESLLYAEGSLPASALLIGLWLRFEEVTAADPENAKELLARPYSPPAHVPGESKSRLM